MFKHILDKIFPYLLRNGDIKFTFKEPIIIAPGEYVEITSGSMGIDKNGEGTFNVTYSRLQSASEAKRTYKKKSNVFNEKTTTYRKYDKILKLIKKGQSISTACVEVGMSQGKEGEKNRPSGHRQTRQKSIQFFNQT